MVNGALECKKLKKLAKAGSELQMVLESKFAGEIINQKFEFQELTVTLGTGSVLKNFEILRDDKDLKFDTLVDLCGIDYSLLEEHDSKNKRFGVVYHFLSTQLNHRVRVKLHCESSVSPQIASITSLWPCAQWYEREAFDLFGIFFDGNSDLRRILTDYGFVGHPFRKDFPISGNVEVRYDPSEKRVVYQPVSIEPREIVPRITRERNYGKE